MKARVHVSLKAGVLDPQGKAIGNALASLGFTDIGEVRQGKLIEIDLDAVRTQDLFDVRALCVGNIHEQQILLPRDPHSWSRRFDRTAQASVDGEGGGDGESLRPRQLALAEEVQQ